MELEVKLDPQHLETLGKTAPITAVIQLIWNALDADAKEVRVVLVDNELGLGGVQEIRVEDDGHGMTQQEVIDGFENLGGSWKRVAVRSPGGRVLHGRDGRGRFLAAGLGNRIAWHTVADDPDDPSRRLAIDVEMKVSDRAHVTVSDPEPTADPTGTRVLIDGFSKPPPGLGGDTPVEKLTGTFGLYLQTNNAHLTYAGEEIDPESLQSHRAEFPIPTENGDDALLVAIEWKKPVDRAIYLCDAGGTPLADQNAGIQAVGFNFTAYLSWTGFADDEALALAELGSGPTKDLLESARDTLRTHFKERAREKTREQIARWKEEKVYPFAGEPEGEVEKATREVFEVVAINAASVVNASEKTGRRLSLRLLAEALEQDPGALHRVLTDVLDLPEERLDELSGLLDHTPLTALIATSKAVANRLEFLRGLEELVLAPDVLKLVKERSQLHRILASETWVFGEEFALTADDGSLTTVLKRHLKILGRDELAEDVGEQVLDAEGHVRIVDLMLARSLQQGRKKREHLVVELKAPSVAIGDDEATQIRRYATAVAKDARFDTTDVEWDFYIVSGKVTGSVEIERKESKDRPQGQIMNAGGIRVWVKTWADIIEDADHRLKFVEEHLNYQPDADQALAYLRKTHAKYLPEQLIDDAAPEDSAADGAAEAPPEGE